MKEQTFCPRCGKAASFGHYEEASVDGIRKETWCDCCGWTHIELLDRETKALIQTEHCDGFGIAIVVGSMGGSADVFCEQITKEDAEKRLKKLIANYSGVIENRYLGWWNGQGLEVLYS